MLIRADVIGSAVALQSLVIESKVLPLGFLPCHIYSFLVLLIPSVSSVLPSDHFLQFLFVDVAIFLEEYFHILAHLMIVIDFV